MTIICKEYKPQKQTAELLDIAFDLIKSVPYKVSLRWLFYELYQRGYYGNKDDYKDKFTPTIARARKSFYKEWRPDTLVDDTRTPLVRGNGFDNEQDFLQKVGEADCLL